MSVLILCNEPIAELKIDHLTTVSRINQEIKAKSAQIAGADWQQEPPEVKFTPALGTNSPEKEIFTCRSHVKISEKPPWFPNAPIRMHYLG